MTIKRAVDILESAAYSVAFPEESDKYGRGFCDGILWCLRTLRRWR